MACNWKSLLPEKYVHLTKCYHVIKQYPSKGENAEIVICTIQDYVLEFSGLRIIGCCKIPSINPKCITFFTSFDSESSPLYIIESNEDVIILNKKKELQVMKQYKNVKRSIISDFTNTGYPQLGIWTEEAKCDEAPNIIVNLHEGNRSISEDCSISNILNEKYEELKMKVKDHEQNLKLKKQHRIYNCEVVDHSKKLSSTSQYELIRLVGEDIREIDPKEHLYRECALQIAETWQRIHNSKWVIGINLCNTGQRNIQDLRLILKTCDEEKLSYISKLVMYCKDELPPPSKRKRMDEELTERVAAWKQIHVLECRRKAIFIGVLDIPKFVNTSVVKISALITYKFDEESNSLGYKVPVSSFQYRVQDYSKRIGSPFSTEITEIDLLSVLVSSITVTLPVVYKANFEPSLSKILIEELKFIEYSRLGCLYHKGTCHVELAGALLHVDKVHPLRYHLSISARDMQQIYLLVHCIYSVLSPPLVLILPPQSPKSKEPEGVNCQLVDEELELVMNQLKHWVVEKQTKITSLMPDIKMPYTEFLKFRAQLCELELKTDVSIVSHN